jgi:hypothetical protein
MLVIDKPKTIFLAEDKSMEKKVEKKSSMRVIPRGWSDQTFW